MKTYVTVVLLKEERTEPLNLRLHSHEISLTPISIVYADVNTKTVG